jgi:hypothetical protein
MRDGHRARAAAADRRATPEPRHPRRRRPQPARYPPVTEAPIVILNSMLQTSPVAAVLAPLVALAAYGATRLLGACATRLRGLRPRSR